MCSFEAVFLVALFVDFQWSINISLRTGILRRCWCGLLNANFLVSDHTPAVDMIEWAWLEILNLMHVFHVVYVVFCAPSSISLA